MVNYFFDNKKDADKLVAALLNCTKIRPAVYTVEIEDNTAIVGILLPETKDNICPYKGLYGVDLQTQEVLKIP